MKISYRREIKRNYLIVNPENEKDAGYEARMLAGNHIQGLLHMKIKYQEGLPCYYYDISSRQPLNRLLETRFITRDEICMILIQLHSTITQMEEFLLREGGILLDPEYVYVDPELFQIGLCLVPDRQGDFQEKLGWFLQYILKRVNHKDRECVVLAYGLYQESLKENFGMEDLLRLTAAEQKNTVDSKMPGNLDNGGKGKEDGSVSKGNRGDCLYPDSGCPLPSLDTDEPEIIPESAPVSSEPLPPPLKMLQPTFSLKKQFLLWLSIVLFIPAFLWGFKGMGAVMQFKYVLLIADGGLLALFAMADILILKFGPGREEHIPNNENRKEEEENPWRILYEEEEEDPQRPLSISHIKNEPSAPITSELNSSSEEVYETALLSDVSQVKALHTLISLQDGTDNIPIPYYPFVIGKHKELADFVLSKDTVSRFHIRLDRDENRLLITDLNSTNGTRVNSRLLEANETVEIKPGDEIYIADIGYSFS